MSFPAGNVGLQLRQVWWSCDTGALKGFNSMGRSDLLKVIPKIENFMEEKLFRAISELFCGNPEVFLSQRVKLPRKHLPTPPGEEVSLGGRRCEGWRWLCLGFW